MGNNCCGKKRIRRRKIVLLLVGLDNAGKTVAAKGLAGERNTSPVPTVGFSVVKLTYGNYDVKIFDLGGGPNIRGIWYRYFVDAYGVIFVVDSSDFPRFDEAKSVLQNMLNNSKIAGKPLLILANKQDHENALDEIDIIEYLDIESLVNDHKCPTLVQSCSATEKNQHKIDLSIKKGYDWLIGYIIRNYEYLNARVETDVIEQEAREREEMLEKLEKIKAAQEEKDKRAEEDAIESYSDYARKLNGDAKTKSKELCETLEYINDKSESFDNVSDTSSESFPPVYYHENVATTDYYSSDRPKSAVEIVKHQLQLNNDIPKQYIKHRVNKTAPLDLYEAKLPHSAQERRKNFAVQERNLKSADDCIFTISNKISNVVGPSGDFHKEIFQLNNFDKPKQLPPLKGNFLRNLNQGDNNKITVVDVE